jgi:circadian clock protein KaiB
MTEKLRLRLYVTGSAPNSQAALTHVHALRATLQFAEVEVIDVLVWPERALDDDVLVTPTLMKLSPLPACRIVGDLSDWRSVLSSLGVLEDVA